MAALVIGSALPYAQPIESTKSETDKGPEGKPDWEPF
jgi:hypothetical protein